MYNRKLFRLWGVEASFVVRKWNFHSQKYLYFLLRLLHIKKVRKKNIFQVLKLYCSSYLKDLHIIIFVLRKGEWKCDQLFSSTNNEKVDPWKPKLGLRFFAFVIVKKCLIIFQKWYTCKSQCDSLRNKENHFQKSMHFLFNFFFHIKKCR